MGKKSSRISINQPKQHTFDSFVVELPFFYIQILTELFLYPLDTWKTRLQYKSIYGLDNANGVRSIYRGFSITLLSTPFVIMFCHVAVAYVIHICLTSFNLESTIKLIAFYGIACALLVLREVIKIRQQLSKMAMNQLNIMKQAYLKDGLMNGIFRGFWITFIVMFIDVVHNLALSREAVFVFLEHRHLSSEIVVFLFVLAILPPLDLAKTAIQNYDTAAVNVVATDSVCYQQLHQLSCVTDENKNNPLKILVHVYLKRGYRGLYAGTTPIAIRMTVIAIFCRILDLIYFYN